MKNITLDAHTGLPVQEVAVRQNPFSFILRVLCILAILLAMNGTAFADGGSAPDPAAAVTTLTAVWYSVGAIALGILGWKVGSRLVARFFR
jgi:hypothetical protein